jgi:cytochrome oxidase Cu insertion factor (SCO1/SenC/PrrC family)
MKRRWNLAIEAGFAISVFAFLSYYFIFVRWPVTRDVPWVNLLLFAAGLGLAALGVMRAYRQPERYRGKVRGPLWGGFGVLIFAAFLFLNFWFSKQMPTGANAPAVGAAAPDFTLPDASGRPATLSSLHKDQWALLIFYRGYW